MPISIPRDYHLTSKGEDFLDEFYSHWQGAGDPAHVIQFLWWLRENGDFQKQLQELMERQGEQKALQAVNWAVEKHYLEVDQEPISDEEEHQITLMGLRTRSERESYLRSRQQDQAKARGDEAEYARLLDLSIHPKAPLNREYDPTDDPREDKICQACGL